MIQDNRLENALHALNHILVRARWMAYEADCRELAELLDDAEILPMYIADREDMTETYQRSLEGISEKLTCCGFVADEYNKTKAPEPSQ